MEFPSVIASVTMCMFLGVALGWQFTSYVLIPGGANALVIGLAVASMGGNGGHSILFIMSINAIALEIGFLFGASIADYLAFREADWRGRAARGGLGVAAENPPISVMMVGLRGCPGVQGGVERHVEQLAPLLAARNCQVEVIARAPHMASSTSILARGRRDARLGASQPQLRSDRSHRRRNSLRGRAAA